MELGTALQYASIPLVSATVGWGTNLLAIKMMFYPIKPIGWPPLLGWQGVIPSKAARMASIAVDLMTERLISPDDLYRRLDPVRVTETLTPILTPMIPEIIDDVMRLQAPRRWRLAPPPLKAAVYARASAEIPAIIGRMMVEIGEHIDDVLDIKQICIDALMRDRRLINRIFLECGRQEFRFIVRSGLGLGFAFGLLQMALWALWPQWWMLPVAGVLVGHATNWLALKMIFYPLEPRQIGRWRWQGLFLKRQAEVSAAYAHLVANHIVSARNLLQGMLRGRASNRLLEIVYKHVRDTTDSSLPPGSERLARLTLGSERLEQIKAQVSDRVMARVPGSLEALGGYADQALDVETTLRERMQALSAPEFEVLLHSAFKEDETKLIIVGAVLGGLAGLAQLLLVFH